MNLTKRESPMVIKKCTCDCCMLVVQKIIWEDKDYDYHISMQDSRCIGKNSLWERIKSACSCLFGKPVYYNDLIIESDEEFIKLVEDMKKLKDFN